jgi:hypothetical protein
MTSVPGQDCELHSFLPVVTEVPVFSLDRVFQLR